jgi:hypothetical protein
MTDPSYIMILSAERAAKCEVIPGDFNVHMHSATFQQAFVSLVRH